MQIPKSKIWSYQKKAVPLQRILKLHAYETSLVVIFYAKTCKGVRAGLNMFYYYDYQNYYDYQKIFAHSYSWDATRFLQ